MADSSEQLIDLDAVLRPDIHVRLNEQDYRLPGDPPSETLLSIGMLLTRLDDADGTDPEALLAIREELSERVHDLFTERQPDLEFGVIKLTDPQLIELVNKLMAVYRGGQGDGEDAPAGRPTSPQRTRSGRRSPARSARKSRSPSSTSSPT